MTPVKDNQSATLESGRGATGGVRYRPGLHRFAVTWVVMTYLLLVLGATVTSKGVGLAVPDWPTTFGYHMFGVPLKLWIGRGGVFWEHSHRLFAAFVGAMTIVMVQVIWLPYLNGRLPFRCQWRWPCVARFEPDRLERDRLWLRWFAVVALILVIVQGVMGGLRVTELSMAWGIVHGVTAQVFLCMTVVTAAATSRLWIESSGGFTGVVGGVAERFGFGLRRLALVLLGVLLVQLVLGASMRHSGARLAIPDFPSAYGRWVPPMTEGSIRAAIDQQPYEQFNQYYSPAQVGIHFAHRVWAVVVTVVTVGFLSMLGKQVAVDNRFVGPVSALAGLLLAQLVLGVLVLWTGGSQVNNEIATAHQAVGAAMLATAVLLAVRVHVLSPPQKASVDHRQKSAFALKEAVA